VSKDQAVNFRWICCKFWTSEPNKWFFRT